MGVFCTLFEALRTLVVIATLDAMMHRSRILLFADAAIVSSNPVSPRKPRDISRTEEFN
jgi:hypothetical protein